MVERKGQGGEYQVSPKRLLRRRIQAVFTVVCSLKALAKRLRFKSWGVDLWSWITAGRLWTVLLDLDKGGLFCSGGDQRRGC